jgi:hypothetical protein
LENSLLISSALRLLCFAARIGFCCFVVV